MFSLIFSYWCCFAPFHLCHMMEKLPVIVFQISSVQTSEHQVSLCWSARSHALHHLPCTVSLNDANGQLSICKISRYAWIPSSKTLEASRYWYRWFNQINWRGVLPFWVLRFRWPYIYIPAPEQSRKFASNSLPLIDPTGYQTSIEWQLIHEGPQHCSIHGVPELWYMHMVIWNAEPLRVVKAMAKASRCDNLQVNMRNSRS